MASGGGYGLMASFLKLKIILLIFFILIGCGNMFSKNKTKFHWLATESAPKNYPMRILSGDLLYHNTSGGLYIPTAASIGYYWGDGESTHVVGETYKPLPDKLDIKFFSFWENKLYHGQFDLPYDKILAMFKAGVAADKERPNFNTIMVGVAPGGAVSVWLDGKETREVFFGQAEPYEAEIKNPLNGAIDDRAEYAQSYLDDLPADVFSSIKKTGVPFGLWNDYRKKFRWNVTVVDSEVPEDLSLSFFNGESYDSKLHDIQKLSKDGLPLPYLFSFHSRNILSGEDYLYVIRFDYTELVDAFNQLNNLDSIVSFEISPKFSKGDTRIRLVSGDKYVDLKKYEVEEF